MAYKWCAVQQCKNTSIKTPDKWFITLPSKPEVRKKWLELGNRNPSDIGANTHAFFCEDHFDMEKDIANYMQLKMGFGKRVQLTKGALPRKSLCQTISEDIEIQPALKESQEINKLASNPTQAKRKIIKRKEKYHRSKAVQTKIPMCDMFTTTNTKGVPFTNEPCSVKSFNTEITQRVQKVLSYEDEEESDSESSDCGDAGTWKDSSEWFTSDFRDDSTWSNDIKINLIKIHRNPLSYVGIPKECYFIVKSLSQQTGISTENVLLCLKKIRLNTTFRELDNNFAIANSSSRKLFRKNIPLIANALRPFIVQLDNTVIKISPTAFRHNYNVVNCIIDYLEINIQKPSNALHEVLTQPDYKKNNSVKFLIACTSTGLINYVSPAFSGRISDVTLLKKCKFLDKLQSGSRVLPNRGFKHIEKIINAKDIKLLRPHKVGGGSKLSKAEVKQTETIVHLKNHIERVLSCLREFRLLSLGSVINRKILRVLNDVLIIACALVNFQCSIVM